MNTTIFAIAALGMFIVFGVYMVVLVDKYGKLDFVRRLAFYLDAYMREGFHETRFRLRDPNTGRHLWFVKLTSQPAKFGPTRFFLRLTQAGCSPDEFNRAQQALAQAGIEYYLTTERDPSPRALVVHCDMDVDKAVRAARCILVNVFGLADDTPIRYGVDGGTAHRRSAMVGWEDSPQLEQYLKKRAAAGKPIPKRYMHLVGRSEG